MFDFNNYDDYELFTKVQSYLQCTVKNILDEALDQLSKSKPQNPILFLGQYLMQNNPENAICTERRNKVKEKQNLKDQRVIQELEQEDDIHTESEEEQPFIVYGKLREQENFIQNKEELRKSNVQRSGSFNYKYSPEKRHPDEQFEQQPQEDVNSQYQPSECSTHGKVFNSAIEGKQKRTGSISYKKKFYDINQETNLLELEEPQLEEDLSESEKERIQLKKKQEQIDQLQQSIYTTDRHSKIIFLEQWNQVEDQQKAICLLKETNLEDFLQEFRNGLPCSLFINLFKLFKNVIEDLTEYFFQTLIILLNSESDLIIKNYVEMIPSIKRFDINMQQLLENEFQDVNFVIAFLKENDEISEQCYEEYQKFLSSL